MKMLNVTIPIFLIVAFVAADATADGRKVGARLAGTEEVPALSTNGHGVFLGKFSVDRQAMTYELSYAGLEGSVVQAHLHVGQRDVNGGVSIFLCTNLGNGPPGTQPCPPTPATIVGTVSAADVIGPAGQGIAAGEWEEFRRAMEEGVVYVNVHTDLFPGGEIRGQLRRNQRRDR